MKADCPRFLRITTLLSIIGFILSLISFAFPNLLGRALSFYFGGLWLLWNGCIFIRINKKKTWLTFLWAIIDVSILMMFFSVASVVNVHSQGTGIAWRIAYLPVWTVINYLSPKFWLSFEETFGFVVSWFGNMYGAVIAEWLAFSTVAATQLLLVLAVLWGIKMWRKKAPTRPLDTDRG